MAELTRWLNDLSEGQIDTFPNRSLRFRNLVLPVLLHRAGHDDQRPIPHQERASFTRSIVTDPKLPRRAEGK